AAPGVSPELDGIVSRLLAKQPTARPASSAQVASTLRAIASRVGSVSTSAPTPKARYDATTARHGHAQPTEASISEVPTNRLKGLPPADHTTVVPDGGF